MMENESEPLPDTNKFRCCGLRYRRKDGKYQYKNGERVVEHADIEPLDVTLFQTDRGHQAVNCILLEHRSLLHEELFGSEFRCNAKEEEVGHPVYAPRPPCPFSCTNKKPNLNAINPEL